MVRRVLYFTAPGALMVREEPIAALQSDQLLVKTLVSGISAGTELLIYRGQFTRDLAEVGDVISSRLEYPLPYGYASVGRVEALGSSVDRDWHGRLVFAFQPHASHFIAAPGEVIPLPDGLDLLDAVFLANAETAVNLVQDAAPILGEHVLVLGQGIVGLLTTALLREFPLQSLATADRFELRRTASLQLGVAGALDPAAGNFREAAGRLSGSRAEGFDLVIELSGSPSALDDAIALTGFSGRIVVGSWYGQKPAALDLGGSFHRSRIRIVSSQVSTISPDLTGRWDKPRRFAVAWEALRRIRPSSWITHRFSLDQAAEAYALLDRAPESALQVVFEYP